MAISFLGSQPFYILLLFFFTTQILAQPAPSNSSTSFSCSVDAPPSCDTYVSYLAQPQFLSLGNISHLFGVSSLSITKASNLVSEQIRLIAGQLLLVPITCGCTGNSYFSNITYEIKKGDNYYLVSINSFENLTNWHAVLDMNALADWCQSNLSFVL
ncbi:hypothetical protein Prudu_019919 [Prunus dulcis]|uniref:Uncharacterized protein n=1 Tax=Prunus dulcis TaxID=3755 RepID=A0A4Y1RU36_PRUDU|nr:hypothetical protein L3X38_039197 [Prunus dulcis]BBH07869.1 hypothetical protein Prudu_019919 [Prunus dulcis]